MPIARKHSLEQLVAALKQMPLPARDRITIEYILLKGVNDGPDAVRELAELLRGVRVKVNLIPYNSVHGLPYQESDEEQIDRFMQGLRAANLTATVRRSRGRDADAACGQLILTSEDSANVH